MEAHMLAGLLLHPVALLLLIGVAWVSAQLLYRNRVIPPFISRRQLLFGYVGVVIACLIVAAASSYISPEEANTKWHVPPERYWNVLFSEFGALSIVLTYFAVLGVALLGAPVIYALARRGFGTVPWVLLASIIISLAAAVLAVPSAHPQYSSEELLQSFIRDAPFFVGIHLVLAVSFCVGARLPWQFRSK